MKKFVTNNNLAIFLNKINRIFDAFHFSKRERAKIILFAFFNCFKMFFFFFISNFCLLNISSKKVRPLLILPKRDRLKLVKIKVKKGKNENPMVYLSFKNKRLCYPFLGLPFNNGQIEKVLCSSNDKKILFSEIKRITNIKEKKTIEKIKIDIGCGSKKRPGFIGIDFFESPDIDICRDVEKQGLPFADSSVLETRCYHVLEHLNNPILVINEIYRVLIPNGLLELSVPIIVGPWALADLTHKNLFNQFTFLNYFDLRFSTKTYSGIINRWEVVEQSIKSSLVVKMIAKK